MKNFLVSSAVIILLAVLWTAIWYMYLVSACSVAQTVTNVVIAGAMTLIAYHRMIKMD